MRLYFLFLCFFSAFTLLLFFNIDHNNNSFEKTEKSYINESSENNKSKSQHNPMFNDVEITDKNSNEIVNTQYSELTMDSTTYKNSLAMIENDKINSLNEAKHKYNVAIEEANLLINDKSSLDNIRRGQGMIQEAERIYTLNVKEIERQYKGQISELNRQYNGQISEINRKNETNK